MSDSEKASPSEAQDALASVAELSAVGFQRGLYSRWFALAMSIWAGLIGTLIVFENPAWIVLAVIGVIVFFVYRSKKGAWAKEVHSKQDLVVVLAASFLLIAMFVAAMIGWHGYGWKWPPVVAGVLCSVGIFSLTEYAYGRIWNQLKSGSKV